MKIEAKNLEISFGNEKILKSVSMLMPEKKKYWNNWTKR